MICPNMATMLCFVTTDANIDKTDLQEATSAAVEQTLQPHQRRWRHEHQRHRHRHGQRRGRKPHDHQRHPIRHAFRAALNHVMLQLAKAMVRDGEKVTKFVEIKVKGAATYLDAQKVAEAVGNSQLVKCSWNGSDPNWGRVMHAIGYSRASIREELIDIYFDGLCATKNGLATDTPIDQLRRRSAGPEFTITIDLHLGDADYTVYTTDLSEAYVDYNRLEYAVKTRR